MRDIEPEESDDLSDAILRLRSLSGPIHSIDLILATRDVASGAEWERLELYVGELDVARRAQFLDVDASESIFWNSLLLTPEALGSFTRMRELKEQYGFESVSPELLAFAALIGDESSGAKRLLRSGGESRQFMRALAAEALLSTQLADLTTHESRDITSEASQDSRRLDLVSSAIDELMFVALATSPAQNGADAADMTTTAQLVRAAIRVEPQIWWRAADEAGIDLPSYAANLEWASDHRPGLVEKRQTDRPSGSGLSSMTDACAQAIERVRRWIEAHQALVLSSEQTQLLLAASLLVDGDVSASAGISEDSRAELRVAVVRAAALLNVDPRIIDADLRSPAELLGQQKIAAAPAAHVEPDAAARATDKKPMKHAQTVGLVIGGYGGAVLISLISGFPFGQAIGLASIAIGGIVSTRRRRVRTVRKPLAAFCVLVALVGVGLAITGSAPIGNDLQAAHLLGHARADVRRGRIDAAIPLLGDAGLIAKQSVAVLVTSACVDWRLHFYDYALLETTGALISGWNPSEASNFDDNNCFLDVPAEYRLQYTYLPNLGWDMVYPQANDATTQPLERIALAEASTHPEFSLIAAACILDHYDLRDSAQLYFTLGLNGAYELGDGKLPFAPLLRCIRQRSLNAHYGYVTSPTNPNYDVYEARGFLDRVPSPQRPNPPANACWAELPLDAPCAQK